MILTNSNCDLITADSEVIQMIVVAPGSYDPVSVTLQHNCCPDEMYTIEILPNTISVWGDIQLTPDLFIEIETTTFPPGIWTVTVVSTETGEDPITEIQCIFLDCDNEIACAVTAYLSNVAVGKTSIHMAYFALVVANSCEEKSCQAMCDVYEYLVLQLNGPDATTCTPCS